MQKYYELTDKIWRELCLIPAPSHHEEKRVAYIQKVFDSWGIASKTDEAKNVIVEIEGETPETVVLAKLTK